MSEGIIETAGAEPTIIDSVLNNPISIIIFALILFTIIVWILNKKQKEKWFKPVPLSSILKEQNAQLLKITMIKGFWGYLRSGDMSLGKIMKVGKLNYIVKNPNYVKPKSKKDVEKTLKDNSKQKHLEQELYIIKISFNPQNFLLYPFVTILELMGINVRYAIVPTSYVKRMTIEEVGFLKQNIDYLNINPKVQVFSVANVFVYGRWAFELVKEISWLYAREKELEELINYPKRVVYLDSTHAKKTDTFEEMDRLERERYSSKIKSLTGGR